MTTVKERCPGVGRIVDVSGQVPNIKPLVCCPDCGRLSLGTWMHGPSREGQKGAVLLMVRLPFHKRVPGQRGPCGRCGHWGERHGLTAYCSVDGCLCPVWRKAQQP